MVRQQAQEVVNFSAFLSFPFFNNPHRRHQEMEEKGCRCQFWLSHGLGGEADHREVRSGEMRVGEGRGALDLGDQRRRRLGEWQFYTYDGGEARVHGGQGRRARGAKRGR